MGQMNQEDLTKAIKQNPFVPVRLKLSNGTTYDIRHPDAILVQVAHPRAQRLLLSQRFS